MQPLKALILIFSWPLLATTINPTHLISAAKGQIGLTVSYDDSYRSIKYPGGDFTLLTGCCTDVLIRAYRKFDLDLQKLVHQDIILNPSSYTKLLTNGKPDRNIDHRRVSVLKEFFSRNAASKPISTNAKDFLPGDIVIWRLSSGRLHIGLVSDIFLKGRPAIIHNIGYGVKCDDVLFHWVIIGHYRYSLPNA